MKHFSGCILVAFICCGCRPSSEKPKGEESQASALASSTANIRKRTNSDASTATRQRLLGDGELRLSLLVFPGDALVELDKIPARRRNGMVEIIGRVGEERRVEVFLDAMTKIEKIVKIEATGVSPPFIDADEEARSKFKPAQGPVVFDNDE